MPSQEYRRSKSRIDKDELSNAIEQVWQVEIMHCMIMQMVKTSKVMQSHKYGKLRSRKGRDTPPRKRRGKSSQSDLPWIKLTRPHCGKIVELISADVGFVIGSANCKSVGT